MFINENDIRVGDKNVLEQLEDRGFDLMTLKFSIAYKEEIMEDV